MGHLLFFIMHFMAIMFGMAFLFFTIPAHLIYAVIAGIGKANRKASKKETGPTPGTHVICPDCKEFIRKGAVICRHCRCQIVPE